MAAEPEWLTLDDDEQIVWQGSPASESLYGAYLAGVPLVLVLGLGLVIILSAYLRRENTDYVVTDAAVYKKTGVFSRSVTEIEFDKIQNTSFSAGPVGRYFGYGNVAISTAGGSGVEMTLRAVADPAGVQELLSTRVTQAQADRGEEPADAEAVLDEILDELRAIRRAVENETTGER